MEYLDRNSPYITKFKEVYKGRNFMTPEILGFVLIKDGIAEISTGDKFMGLDMYGITILVWNYPSLDHLSKCVNSFEEVKNYIKELQ